MKRKVLNILFTVFTFTVCLTCSTDIIKCDFWAGEPGASSWIVSDTYASSEDCINGTPSDPAAVAASKAEYAAREEKYKDGDPDNPNWQRAHGITPSVNSSSSSKSKPAAPTLTEYDADSQPTYVVTSKKAVYDDFNKGRNEIGSVSKGTEVVVTGKSSNGYYRFDYTAEDGTSTTGYLLFEGKDNIVPKEDYDAAWAESNRVEATCEKDGYIEYTNGLSGLKYKDELKATGHVLGDEELTKEPTWTKPGEIVTHCATCNEVIDSREIPQIVPTWCWWLIGGAAVLCVAMITVTIVIVKKRNKDN